MSGPAGDVAGALVQALGPGSGIGVAVHDEDLRVLVISPSLAELSGTEPDALLGRRLTEVLPGEVGEVAETSIPFMPGIRTSSRATSGWHSTIPASACSPSAAWPTTSSAGCSATSRATPARYPS